ncbi:sensor histidine kinase YesM [Sedimentibacter acidaminivorans]|jgi:histidine kinase/DNA gyrase B/HSP90-like ATPase|uniref:histidine kinase n=1 Tax=Sedimentibacter acidaminivorans TaxID=913099 RepID=A0ABS4GBY8_9FIRM|nr:ATP-binding protein [Sedimentibacter acidaminivorans]MBP1924915.1 sensor histidine kinase YesM [Sedimentibacter acidaminivorans]
MKELSMHILDIAMNSVKAEAKLIEITVEDSIKNNSIKITIKDDGKGMSKEILENVANPFYTTRTTRKVGLGLSMLKEASERCNGYLKINSQLGVGTIVESFFERNNIDRAPLGNIADTILVIVNSLKNCNLIYNHVVDDNSFTISTQQLKEILGEVVISDSNVVMWIKEYVNENINDLYKN